VSRGSWLRIKTVARRHGYALQRKPPRWFDVLIWPLVDALLFGSIGVYLARATGQGSHGVGLLLSGILLFHVVFQSEISVSTGFMEETWSRNLLNLMVTPLRESEYVIGTALFGLFKLVIGVGVVALTAGALFAFNVTSIGLPLVPIVAVLLFVGWAVALVVIGLILRFGDGAEILAWGLLSIVLPLSGAFYPISAMPGPIQALAKLLPTTRVFGAARAVVAGRAMPWGDLAVGAIGTLVVAAAALFYATRMLALFRARGYISRYT
jgi:ABC-2 type transport system permease protein